MNTVAFACIYERPKSHPKHYVVWCWRWKGTSQVRDGQPHAVVASLQQAQDALPAHLTICLGRAEFDHPCHLETWLASNAWDDLNP